MGRSTLGPFAMRQSESTSDFHRHVSRRDVRNITDFKLDVTELREQTLASNQYRELRLLAIWIVFGIFGHLKSGLELELFALAQFLDAPCNTALSAIPHASGRLCRQ